MSGLAFATLTGFLRQIVIAQQFGVGRAADIYLVAFVLPEFIFIALPIVLTPAFLPPFTACRQQAGEAIAMQMGRLSVIALLILLSIFSLVVGLGAPVILSWLGPGFDLTERARAIQSTRMMLPAINFMGLAILGGIISQAYRRFFPPAFTTPVYNLTFVITLLAFPVMLLDDRAAWGVTLGAAMAMALQWPVWRKLFFHSFSNANNESKASSTTSRIWLSQVAHLAIPLWLGYSVHHLILIIDRSMATTLGTGSVAALDFASRLAQVVGQLGALAISTVLFPSLVEQIENHNLDGAKRSLTGALRWTWIITLPACLWLIVLRVPLVQVLFERGAFDRSDTLVVSDALVWYSLAVLADAVCQPLWRVIYAQRRTWTVVAVNGIQTVVRVFGNIVLMRYFGYNGLALSACIGLSIQALILGIIVYKQLGFRSTSSGWREAGFITIAGLLAAGSTYIVESRFGFGGPVITLLTSVVLGISIYFLVLLWPRYLKRQKNKKLNPV
jgi:putative peptidoglycan lipid II flippase